MIGAHSLGSIELASLSLGENDWQLAITSNDTVKSIALRPPPPLSLLAFLPQVLPCFCAAYAYSALGSHSVQGELAVLTITGDVIKVPVNHALLKFYLLVTMPSVEEAVSWYVHSHSC